jgi:cytochrome c peroxidase
VAAPPDNQVQQLELLGKALLYDEQLSVNRYEACALCHMPDAGFTGPISQLNKSTVAYPGSERTRFSDRKPLTLGYALFLPVLHFNPYQGDMVGGNFWDMRATGRRLGNPAAEQAEGPPVNPVEMGLVDPAWKCIAPHGGRTASCSRRSGESRHSQSDGRRTLGQFAIGPDLCGPRAPSGYI